MAEHDVTRSWAPAVPLCLRAAYRGVHSHLLGGMSCRSCPDPLLWRSGPQLKGADPRMLPLEEALDPQLWVGSDQQLLVWAPDFMRPDLYPAGLPCKFCKQTGHVARKAVRQDGPRFMEPDIWVLSYSCVPCAPRRARQR